MKKALIVMLAAMTFLTGCGSDASLLKPYSISTNTLSEGASAMLAADAFKGFAYDIGFVSLADLENGTYSEPVRGLSAYEAFLAGTADHEILAASGIYQQMPPASLTKLLNALVVLENVGDLDQEITLDDNCYCSVPDAQVCGLSAGDVISLRTLLYGMLIYSGNDAANALAAYVGGTIPEFCDMMNAKAAQIGATDTHFVTPNGLDDPEHYSSAYDLYLIFSECLKYDLFKEIISQNSVNMVYRHNGEEFSLYLPSTNYYLLGYKDPPEGISVIGGKTGTTDQAGLCLILYVENAQKEGYISVLLGCPDKDTLYSDMTNLLSAIRN